MASEKQLNKWYNEAVKLSSNPEYASSYAYYRQIAKVADQRLLSLEKLSTQKHFTNVLKYSYAGAIRDIESWGGTKRFNTKPPTNLNQLEAKIADIEKFLSKPTSKKSTILSTYKQRSNTINERYGTDFTWQDIANYYEKEKGKISDVAKGSKTEVRALGVLKRINTDDDLNVLERLGDKDVKDIMNKANKGQKLTKREQATLDEINYAKSNISRVAGKDKILANVALKLLESGRTYETLMGGN